MIKLSKFVCGVLLAGCMAAQAQQPKSVDFYLTPSISAELLKSSGAYIKEFLEKETGLTIQLKIPGSYDELIDDFGGQNSCFAFMSSQSYIVANVKHKAVVKLRTVRFGHSVYQGMIVTHASSGIKTLDDLQGKTIGYTDELSTSGYLYPRKILQRKKIKPGKEIFLKKHDEVMRQVYEKKIDAGSAFYSDPSSTGEIRDARSRILEKYPDAGQKIVILVKTDLIPNDPVVFSKNFDANLSNKICLALMKLSATEKGKQTLTELYGVEGFVKASDADYNSLRSVMNETESK
jgi:phosphonate transport system substrate-binding protein